MQKAQVKQLSSNFFFVKIINGFSNALYCIFVILQWKVVTGPDYLKSVLNMLKPAGSHQCRESPSTPLLGTVCFPLRAHRSYALFKTRTPGSSRRAFGKCIYLSDKPCICVNVKAYQCTRSSAFCLADATG